MIEVHWNLSVCFSHWLVHTKMWSSYILMLFHILAPSVLKRFINEQGIKDSQSNFQEGMCFCSLSTVEMWFFSCAMSKHCPTDPFGMVYLITEQHRQALLILGKLYIFYTILKLLPSSQHWKLFGCKCVYRAIPFSTPITESFWYLSGMGHLAYFLMVWSCCIVLNKPFQLCLRGWIRDSHFQSFY